MKLLRKRIELPKSPDRNILETFQNKVKARGYEVVFKTNEFTSICPVTGQPDFASIEIRYIPDELCIESKSLKFYLYSYRNTGDFHEHITNRILSDIVFSCKPKWAKITGAFNIRGGIGITVEAEHNAGYKRV